MLRASNPLRLLAAGLSALAGFVDAVGYIQLGGFFVSFMSGNSTRLGIGLAAHLAEARIAAALISGFVAGVILGSIVGRVAGRWRPVVVPLLAAALLGAAALLREGAASGLGTWAMVLAMGALNAVFEEDGEVRIGVTYMTGTLVKVGQRLAALAWGGPAWAWLPYLLQWLSLAAGAVAGALAVVQLGSAALWIAAAAAFICASGAIWLVPRAR